MDSMQYGKGAAQAAHAANLFTYNEIISYYDKNQADQIDPEVLAWQQSGGGFGTTITLAVTETQMYAAVNLAFENSKLKAAIVRDNTYPLLDGETLHLFPVHTTAYIFGKKREAQPIIGDLPLLSNKKVIV